MIKEGTEVYYIEEGSIYSGKVIDAAPSGTGDDFTFSIDSYGACEGQYVIASSQIGKTVFFAEEEAEKQLGR